MKRKLSLLLVVLLITSLFLTACGKSNSPSAPAPANSSSSQPVKDTKVTTPKSFSIGTSAITGSYYILGGPLAKLISEKMSGYSATHQATDGPAANLQMIENDEMFIALCSVLSAYQGYNGIGFAKNIGKKLVKARALFMTHNSYYQCITLKNMNINTHRDLNGKIVDVTMPGSTPYIALTEFIDALGITPKKVINSSLAQDVDAMKDGRVNNGLAVTGYPNGTMQDFAGTHDAVLVDFTKEEMDAIMAKYPYYSPAVIPANTYKGQTKDVNTFQFWNMAVAHKDLPDEFVYDLLTKVYENVGMFKASYAAAEIKPEAVLESKTPLHPGAVKYYRDHGIKIPDALIPPEMK